MHQGNNSYVGSTARQRYRIPQSAAALLKAKVLAQAAKVKEVLHVAKYYRPAQRRGITAARSEAAYQRGTVVVPAQARAGRHHQAAARCWHQRAVRAATSSMEGRRPLQKHVCNSRMLEGKQLYMKAQGIRM